MKRFFENTLISGAYSKALRVVALLCVLLGVSTSAWADFYIWGFNGQDMNVTPNPKAQKMTNNSGAWSYTHSKFNDGNYVFFITTSNSTDQSTAYSQAVMNLSMESGSFDLRQGSYGGKILYHIWNSNKQEVTITYNTATGKLTATSSSGGGGTVTPTCTPSAKITGLTLNDGNVTLTGSLTETCGKDTYYGWQYCTDGKSWSDNVYIAGAPNNGHHSESAVASYSQTWKLPTSDTYYFRAYAYQNGKFYSDGTVLNTNQTVSSDCKTIYLKPNGNWKDAGAWFAARFWSKSDGSDEQWVKMKFANECQFAGELYYCTIPEGLTKVIFCRMNPSASTMSFDNKWDQTNDLTVSDTNNQYTVAEGAWSNGDGTWSVSECTQTDCQVIAPEVPEVNYDTEVLLTYDAEYDESKDEAKVFAYYKKDPGTDQCSNVTIYGFAYCQGYGCVPNEESTKVEVGNYGLPRGEDFDATLTGLAKNSVYGYRAYVYSAGKYVFSGETRYFSTGGCVPIPGGGDTIRVTVDGLKYRDDESYPCKLIYGNFQAAIDDLKNNTEYCVNGNLRQPVVISVAQKADDACYYGKVQTVSGGAGGTSQDLTVNVISGINKGGIGYDEKNVLIVRANNGDKPKIEHLLIRSSRNVIIEGINIISNPTESGKTKDTALEIDNGRTTDWENGRCDLTDANITVRNCQIGSNGFTGMHVNGVDNLVFENNVFNLSYDIAGLSDIDKDNVIYWGASVKFLECKNIKFIRNNIWGAHNTLFWVQQTANALFYNNVFWNTNTIKASTRAIRVYSQWSGDGRIQPNNLAFLYNTFYFADGTSTASEHYDFLSSECPNSECHSIGTVVFKYNNCYSYDGEVKSKSSKWAEKFGTGYCDRFTPNHFWSQYDLVNHSKKSVFELSDDDKNKCTNADLVNIKNYVCETSANGPASLIIKQSQDPTDLGLKTATPVTVTEVKGWSGLSNITDEDLKADRYRNDIRMGGAWTYGAYEATSERTVNNATIYWIGGDSNEWDNRNNWAYINSDGKDQVLTCVDILPEDLKIVIPRRYSNSGYPVTSKGTYYYPEIPTNFDAAARREATKSEDMRSGIPAEEQVSAGVGVDGVTPIKYAESIELEYGAAITGVENLAKDGEEVRYSEASVGFEAPRSQWILVGTVVRPWTDNTKQSTRNVKSGDYFVPNQLPHVYMHKAKLESQVVNDETNWVTSWDETFASREEQVPVQSIFAIRIPDQYGPYKLSYANYTNYGFGTPEYGPDDAIKYSNFTGKFVNESSLPVYTGLTPGKPALLNNSYPCCIDPAKIPASAGTVLCYNYTDNDWHAHNSFERKEVLINPQHGFVFTPAEDKYTFEVTKDMLVGADTRSRSAEIELPTLSLSLRNANTLVGASSVVLRVDELLGDEESLANTPKVFATNAGTPELYIIANDKLYTTYDLKSSSEVIPLGVKLKQDMNIVFKKIYSKDLEKAILVDTYTDREYNLLERSYTTEALVAGVIEGRFFLNLGATENTDDNEDTSDDFISTEVEENDANKTINIFVDETKTIRVVTNGVELKSIYVSDMSGRSMRYDVKGFAANLKLPVSQGVYTVSVIGDTANRTEKVILK